ncbi:bifunctional diguanylate cyclase/phosphodiesterase [Marinobacter caseinilyticus]|uniref:bifunctional diguanylate cyclase/phosphodiesterase n=1 Tax=Marinobacter caseinilyticus TaxID=2692195 RepID=UPI0014095F41|nr:EAL domain-containing protein [Marinobacter caseinilyticus]
MQYRQPHYQKCMMSLRSVLLIFTGSLILTLLLASVSISFDRFRDYIATQMQGHAQDAATAVGLSLSNAIDGRDPVASSSLIDAAFDSGGGRYLSIHYYDHRGNLIAGREASQDGLPVPAWFVSLAALPPSMGEAQVVRGWQQLGIVQVVSHPGPAYQDLWRITGAIVVGTVLIGGLALVILWWLLTRTLAPLKVLEAQAEAIGRRDFRQRVSRASTRELNRVTEAMNQMAGHLGELFDGQAKLIQHLRRLNNEDNVTGLASHQAFDQRLKVEVESKETAFIGSLLLLQLAGFADINQRFGREEADRLLVCLADVIKAFEQGHAGAFSGRRTGAEFAVFMPGVSLADGLYWSEQLIVELDSVYSDFADPVKIAVHGGVAQVEEGMDASDLLAACDEALRRAQLENGSGCFSADTAITHHHGAEAWRELLIKAMDDEQVSLWQQPVLASDGVTVMHRQVFSRLRVDGEWIKGAVFVPMAERFGLMARLDLMVMDRALAWLARDPGLALSMTLGHSSLADPAFLQGVVARLQATTFQDRFWVGLPEQALSHHRIEIGQLVKALRKLGVGFIVERFGVGGVPFNYLRNLPFKALRIDHSFIHEIHRHEDNNFYLESIVAIAHSRGVEVFVSGVETAQEWALLQTLNIDGASGFHLGRPEAVDHRGDAS